MPEPSIRLCGASIDLCPDPLGFSLEDLTWDIDREVFLASTTLISHDEPLAFVPDTIREWIGLGWKLGSYHDTYVEPEEDDSESAIPSVDDGEYERLEQLHIRLTQLVDDVFRRVTPRSSCCHSQILLDPAARLTLGLARVLGAGQHITSRMARLSGSTCAGH